MKNTRKTWTYYKGDWHEGDVRILGAASQSTWLSSLVFDGARGVEGISPDLDRHAERVNDSAKTFGLKSMLTADAIAGLAKDGRKKFGPDADSHSRPEDWPEGDETGFILPLSESTDFALCLEEVPMAAPNGFSVTTVSYRRPTIDVMPVNAKAACLYANNARMLREARAKGFNNAIVCDANGNVAEFATSNIFMTRGGEVFSPVPNGTFLNGITRQRVIGLLRQAGVTVHEATLTLEDFRTADEIFSTGNISKVMPVTAFDDRRLEYGPIARKARALYWEWAHG